MDIQYLLFLQNLREATGGIFNQFMMFITDLGSGPMPFLVLMGLYWCIDKRAGEYLITNTFIANWVNGIVKITACVYRPWIRSADLKPYPAALETATGYSFPSGHTAKAVSVWAGMAAYYREHHALRNGLIFMAILIGFSRNYLGVHTPQDVLVSAAIGVLFLFLNSKMLGWISRESKREWWFITGGAILAAAMVLYASLKSFPMDYVDGKLLVDPAKMTLDSWAAGGDILGFGVGMFIERRWIRFSTEGTAVQKLTRFFFGALVYLAIYYALNSALGLIIPAAPAKFLSKFIMALHILVFVPWFIKLSEAKRSRKISQAAI